ncbi:hypothetical protein OAC51_10030, partial [Flavobacteriaceae bacterium]|nr:hypothetical protein [Flavobacteriaceae bacterium]
MRGFLGENGSGGLLITEQTADQIIDTQVEQLNKQLKKILHYSKIQQKGKMKSTLLFKANKEYVR